MDGLDDFGGDEDAALRYAIALSLQDTGNSSSKTPIEIESDDDGDDDDLDKGPTYPRITKEPEFHSGKLEPQIASLPKQSSVSQPSPSPAPSGLAALGLDRKKMEEERLARLRKRKAAEPEPESRDRRQRQKLDTEFVVGPATESGVHLPYPKGTVKKTWAKGFPRKDDIKIEEVLQKDELELAVISSFQWDEQWMLSKIDYKKTKIVCIAFASNEAQIIVTSQQEEMKANVPSGATIKFCFPPMMPTGNMHSKLQLLKFPSYLRVVVPSGNLVPYDWGETGVIENIVFLIDLPRVDNPKSATSTKLGLFAEELCYFLRAQGLEESLVSSLKNYDFSEADRYRFVHTIGGSHDIVGLVELRGGRNAAGTICVQSKWWDSASFPRELIRDCKSVRSGLLIHSKLMLVCHSDSNESKPAFAYLGSANVSESAWGRLVKERGTGNLKLTCRNWECGVIVPISPRDLAEDGSRPSSVSDFYGTIPVPMSIPGEAYGDIKSRRPWLFLEN
ncbi:hypothetical protein Daesc_005037 [Daldinia eschscholtzii]|uniref:PLD phosphodiesterase domain-containing protein n=1 Tax=Daldinia eschscholtzii TaxID=292717 RepID=A0AAX6MJX1_9PEZI